MSFEGRVVKYLLVSLKCNNNSTSYLQHGDHLPESQVSFLTNLLINTFSSFSLEQITKVANLLYTKVNDEKCATKKRTLERKNLKIMENLKCIILGMT